MKGNKALGQQAAELEFTMTSEVRRVLAARV